VWGKDFLSRYDPDAFRYYLTMIMPETRDADWDWEEFYHRNNDELVATWGNLANRVLSFAYKYWEGVVPDPGPLTDLDTALLETIESGFDRVGNELEQVHLRAALTEVMCLATEVNKYLDQTAPWMNIKNDAQVAARAIFVAMKAIDSLKILFAPFLPFTSQQLHKFLGHKSQLFGRQYVETVKDALGEHMTLRYDPTRATGEWKPSTLQPGDEFQKPGPLFKKLDISIIAAERERMGC
jgi:methionyl-tRNA synthetase